MRLYRRGIPFFMGLICDIVIACLLYAPSARIRNTRMYMFFPG